MDVYGIGELLTRNVSVFDDDAFKDIDSESILNATIQSSFMFAKSNDPE